MKRFVVALAVFGMVFVTLFKPVVAEELSVNSEPTVNFKAENGVDEPTPVGPPVIITHHDVPGPRAVGLLKCVIFVAKAIIGGIIYDVVKYIATHETDWNAVEQWASENGLDPNDYEITIERVVYDNGCWKPEFPANPFCKMVQE